MSYQPPLVGSKQLLNFHATSWPDIGGWAIVLALVLAAVALILDRRRSAGAARP
jgi:copper chaperone NosL